MKSKDNDIAERTKLKVQLDLFASIINSSDDAIISKTLGGIITSWNPGAQKIFGYTAAEVTGKHISILIPAHLQHEENEIMKKIRKGKVFDHYETERIGKDGNIIYVSLTISPVRDEAENITGASKIVRDITTRKKALEEIESTAEQLRQLTAHLQTIREEERKRIAREIHDELGQQLTAIKMDVVWIDKKIPEETIPVKSKLKNIISLLDRGDQSVRNILNKLRPAILDDYGLQDALKWQGRQFTETTGIPVKFITAETTIKLPEEIVTGIFRVYQESLTNIMRYAKARKVLTTLNIKDNTINLIVEDDGKGFDSKAVPVKKSFGILGMKERVLSLNGKFELVSSPGKGTKISITLPYKTDEQTQKLSE